MRYDPHQGLFMMSNSPSAVEIAHAKALVEQLRGQIAERTWFERLKFRFLTDREQVQLIVTETELEMVERFKQRSPTDHAIAALDALGVPSDARHPLHRR